jgi:hypothetical protein
LWWMAGEGPWGRNEIRPVLALAPPDRGHLLVHRTRLTVHPSTC